MTNARRLGFLLKGLGRSEVRKHSSNKPRHILLVSTCGECATHEEPLVKDMILATRWTAKGYTKEPQEEKKGVRALIDAGVETSTSIIKYLKVRVCAPGGIGGQGGGIIGV